MNTNELMPIMLVVVAIVAIVVLAWVTYRSWRTHHLRDRFGPEYDRLINDNGGRSRAEKELDRRAKRVDRLEIRPLAPERRSRYSALWDDQQARFVDEPEIAVSEADHLVEEVMKERGYPVAEFDQRAADVSVDHPRMVENYRAAHQIVMEHRRGVRNTEDLRRAMIYYRDLFRELLEDTPVPMGAHNR
jgi:hypothetical protein